MSRLLDLVATQADETEYLEARVKGAATATLAKDLDALQTATTKAYVVAFGSTRARPAPAATAKLAGRVGSKVASSLAAAHPVARTAIATGIVAGAALGVEHARAQVALFERPPDVEDPGPTDEITRSAAGAISALDDQRDAALALLGGAVGYGSLLAAISRARMGMVRVGLAASWALIRSMASGARTVADAGELQRVWSAKSDACFACADLAGTINPDDPPAHPNCRCEVVMLRPTWAGAAALPGALSVIAGDGGEGDDGEGQGEAPSVLLDTPPSVMAAVNHLLSGHLS